MPAPTHTSWSKGWYNKAKHLASPNYGARPADALIDLIVVHSISLPPGIYGGDHVQALFTNRLDWNAHAYYQGLRGMEVSSHFYIDREGVLWQFVGTFDRAWHAGKSHYRGRDNCNDDSIGIELEGIEGDFFTPIQYEVLGQICRDLTNLHPIRYVAGHVHIAPGRKSDPGLGFDWEAFEQKLACKTIVFPSIN